jgi:hypothetical protein
MNYIEGEGTLEANSSVPTGSIREARRTNRKQQKSDSVGIFQGSVWMVTQEREVICGCDKWRTEKDGINVVCMGCRHVVSDKKSKNSERRLHKQRRKVQD